VRVAESDGAIVGFGAVDRYSDGWELSHLWILPEYMRRGIGQRLVSELCEAARLAGAERLRIESDPQAEPFYLRQGAVRVGDTPAPMPGAPQRTLPILELDLLRPKRNVGAE
jgi:predicted N-acetyltransferase YhbS